MNIIYGSKHHIIVVKNLTPEMLRQMEAWQRANIANISLVGFPPGSQTFVLVHIDQVHVELSIMGYMACPR